MNKVFLMFHVFNLKISENGFVADHINAFNMIISQSSFIKINFNDEIRALRCLLYFESWDTNIFAISSSHVLRS